MPGVSTPATGPGTRGRRDRGREERRGKDEGEVAADARRRVGVVDRRRDPEDARVGVGVDPVDAELAAAERQDRQCAVAGDVRRGVVRGPIAPAHRGVVGGQGVGAGACR